jgi:hypothetical protein
MITEAIKLNGAAISETTTMIASYSFKLAFSPDLRHEPGLKAPTH